MANTQSYEDKNERYKNDIKRNKNFTYLVKEIQLNLILPHLQGILHHSDYQTLHRRRDNSSDWDCNQYLLECLQKREYWWRALRKALVENEYNNIIERLGWTEDTFDFGPDDGNSRNEQNLGASSNPPQNNEKPNKKSEAIEEYTQRKLDVPVYKKQNDLSKASDYTKSEKCEQDCRVVDSNLLSSKCEKYDTDYRKSLSDETELKKVPETEIHPAVRNNPMMDTDQGAVAFPPTLQPFSNHRNLSAPIMNPASRPFSGDEFNPSVMSTDQSPMLVPPSIDLRDIESKDDLSDAEQQEVDLREQNLQLHERGDNDSLSKQDVNWSDSVPENLESGANDGQNSDTAIQEILPPTSTCQSNMADTITTNDDVIRPPIASTVDPTGVSRKNNVRGEKILRHTSSNLSKELDSYVTGLHSYGSDVTSSIQSESQTSNLDIDQTEAKTCVSITRVDALDDWNFNSNDLDPSRIQLLVQNSADVQNPVQVPVDTMPELFELLSQGSSVDPSDYVEPGAIPQPSTQFHADGSAAANNVDNVASNMQPENNIVQSEGITEHSSLIQRISNTFDSIVEIAYFLSE